MKKAWIVLALMLGISACGDAPVYIADQVRFRVWFSEKVVQVSFEMNKDYQIKQASRFPFDTLGTVFLKWIPEQEYNEIGVALKADPAVLNQGWPTTLLRKFPNGKELPESVPLSWLLTWRMEDENLKLNLSFKDSGDLISGGALLSRQFDILPENFLATQKFRVDNGDITATISATGPVKNPETPGGVYFFGNFGKNPFAKAGRTTTENYKEWVLKASSPAEIISIGKISRRNSSLNLWERLKNLASELRMFQSERNARPH